MAEIPAERLAELRALAERHASTFPRRVDELEAARPEGWESVAALQEAYTRTEADLLAVQEELGRVRAELARAEDYKAQWRHQAETATGMVPQLRVELAKAREAGEKWRRIISDLDRCPHGRHEGDTCAGWRGPGLYDGGCKDGLSLGNPLYGASAVLGIDYSSTRLIAVPEERADRVNPDAWYQPRRADEELHHFLPGYMPEDVADVAAAAAAPSAVEAS